MYKKSIKREIKNKITTFKNFFRFILYSHKFPPFFQYKSEKLKYFVHYYNKTWANSRSVEIPIALYWLEKYKNKKILEIGNVLSHYVKTKHLIIDKYDIRRSSKTISEDIVDFKSDIKYDLILSISTFEHIGIDEALFESDKVIKAFKSIKNLLADDGIAIITAPYGYNLCLNGLIENTFFDKIIFYYKNKQWFEESKIDRIKEFSSYFLSEYKKNVIILELKKDDIIL